MTLFHKGFSQCVGHCCGLDALVNARNYAKLGKFVKLREHKTSTAVLSSVFYCFIKKLIKKSVDAINRSLVYILRQKSSPDDLMNIHLVGKQRSRARILSNICNQEKRSKFLWSFLNRQTITFLSTIQSHVVIALQS